jgi:hypothetical protein
VELRPVQHESENFIVVNTLRRIYAIDDVNQLECAWRAWREQSLAAK